MSLTENEFRSLLAERAATPGPAVDRLNAVRGRITRRRHRQQTVVGVAIAAVLLGGGLALPHVGTRAAAKVATPAPTPTPLLAEYGFGGQLLGSAVLQSPQQGEVSMTFTPTNWHLQIQVDCAGEWTSPSWSAVQVNGHPLMEGSDCGGGASGPFGGDQAFWSQLGVRLGRPSTITLSLIAPPVDTAKDLCRTCSPAPNGPEPLPAPQRPSGRLAVGVYQRVPVSDYPLPPQPAKLQDLPRVTGPGTLDSRVVGANGTFTVLARVGPHSEIRTTAIAPGALRLLVNGKPINENDSWRWDVTAGADTDLTQGTLKGAGLEIPDGTTVAVTLEASRFTVPGWTLEVMTRS